MIERDDTRALVVMDVITKQLRVRLVANLHAGPAIAPDLVPLNEATAGCTEPEARRRTAVDARVADDWRGRVGHLDA